MGSPTRCEWVRGEAINLGSLKLPLARRTRGTDFIYEQGCSNPTSIIKSRACWFRETSHEPGRRMMRPISVGGSCPHIRGGVKKERGRRLSEPHAAAHAASAWVGQPLQVLNYHRSHLNFIKMHLKFSTKKICIFKIR